MPWDRHGGRIDAGAEEPRDVAAGRAIDHIGAVVGLSEAPDDARPAEKSEVTIEEGHDRHQPAFGSVGRAHAQRFEARVQMPLQERRIDEVGDDREMLQRRLGARPSGLGTVENVRREAQFLQSERIVVRHGQVHRQGRARRRLRRAAITQSDVSTALSPSAALPRDCAAGR